LLFSFIKSFALSSSPLARKNYNIIHIDNCQHKMKNKTLT